MTEDNEILHPARYRQARQLNHEGRRQLFDLAGCAVPSSLIRMSNSPLEVRDAFGHRFLVEHAGVWDSSPRGDRVTVYYEDEIRPDDAPPLYRVTLDSSLGWQDETEDHPLWLRRIMRALIGAIDGWRGERRDWRAGSSW